MSGRLRRGVVIFAVACASCANDVEEIAPVGEVLVVVDTDMPVPKIVSRLRIDLYAPDGTWFESRDVGRIKRSDWPTSFGVYLPDRSRESSVLVRLRAYREGEVHDYRGERFVGVADGARPFEVPALPPPTNAPRLLRDDGTDVTPLTEPDAPVTIDRLIVVRVLPNARLSAHVVLRGACIGTMADIAGRRSCIDTEKTLSAVVEAQTTTDSTLGDSVVGSFEVARPCTATPRAPSKTANGTPLFDDEVCIDGALFVFGSKDGFGAGDTDDVPRRIAVLPPFRIDRYEVTVARMRDAIRRGLSVSGDGRLLLVNDGPLPTSAIDPEDPKGCTFSTKDQGRDTHPVNCMSWELARAFCELDGGDLPTEAQWEYVTAHAGRASEARYAWPDDGDHAPPTCEQAVFGRGPFPFDDECNRDGTQFGIAPVGSRVGPRGDVSPGGGVVDLTGNVSEYMRDAFASFASNCWASQKLETPACLAEPAAAHTVRGGSWFLPGGSIHAAFRQVVPNSRSSTSLGIRCVRPGN